MYGLKGTREIKKTGVLDEDRFYRLLSERCNYISQENVRAFYLALVKLVVAELRENGIIRLPHIGDLAIIKQKDRPGLAGKTKAMIRGAHIIKFYPFYALKDYFSKLSSTTSRDLDPRKLIGKVSDE